MKAELKNYRQSPRKVRIVADLIRGKKVGDALKALQFANKRASDPINKLLESAISNATNNFKAEKDDLFVKSIEVNKAVTMKRIMPRARGSASRINKRGSHVTVVLEAKSSKLEAK